MNIYVGGVNAVGKSTLLKKAAEELGCEYIHMTSGLLQYLGFGNDYEKLRALTQLERDTKLGEYVQTLFNRQDQQPRANMLFDSHYLALVRGKVDRVTGPWSEYFDAFVLLSAPLDNVWERLDEDSKTRDRGLFPIDITSEVERKNIIESYQKQILEEFERLVKMYGKPSVVIENKKGLLSEAVEELVVFLTYLHKCAMNSIESTK